MIINNIKFSIVLSIGLISSAIIASFNGCGYDEECCSLTKSPTAIISGFKNEETIVTASVPIFLSVNGTSSFDDGNLTSYEWFVNGASVANTMIGNLEVNPGVNKICLVVTDDDNQTNKTCQTVTFQRPSEVVPEVKPEVKPEEDKLTCQQKLEAGQGGDPKAVITMVDDIANKEITDNTLERAKTYSLSCEESKDDCGDNVKCEWGATSYLLDPATGVKTPFIVDCFNDNPADGSQGHSQHGEKLTTSDEPPSSITLCSSTTAFNRIEVSLKVTDDYNNTTTTTEIYNVP